MHAVKIDAGFEDVGVARQTHGGQKAAVGSAPETDPLRVNVVECLQKFRDRDYVLVFGLRRATPTLAAGERRART